MSKEEREAYLREPPPEIRAKLIEMMRNPKPPPVVPEYDGPPIPELDLTAEEIRELADNARGFEDIFDLIDRIEGSH